jgi:hypothetical protein
MPGKILKIWKRWADKKIFWTGCHLSLPGNIFRSNSKKHTIKFESKTNIDENPEKSGSFMGRQASPS